jgi:hypothetical protein
MLTLAGASQRSYADLTSRKAFPVTRPARLHQLTVCVIRSRGLLPERFEDSQLVPRCFHPILSKQLGRTPAH